MKFAKVEISTVDGAVSKLVLDGYDLTKYLAGFRYEHKANEVPVLHLDLYVEEMNANKNDH